jgi:hypothetical protein
MRKFCSNSYERRTKHPNILDIDRRAIFLTLFRCFRRYRSSYIYNVIYSYSLPCAESVHPPFGKRQLR